MATLLDIVQKQLEKTHPVGSYYITEDESDPSSILGIGTWTKVEGRFLLGASSTHPIGEMAGEETHVLTNAELAPHSHGVTVDVMMISDPSLAFRINDSNFDGLAASDNLNDKAGVRCTNQQKQFVGTDGEGKPHNNMPPYRAVNIWRRIK